MRSSMLLVYIFRIAHRTLAKDMPLLQPGVSCCFCSLDEPRQAPKECNSILDFFGHSDLYPPTFGKCSNVTRLPVLIGSGPSALKFRLGPWLDDPDKFIVFRFCGSNPERYKEFVGSRTDFWISNGQFWRNQSNCDSFFPSPAKMVGAEPRKFSRRNEPRYICGAKNRKSQVRFSHDYEKFTNGTYVTLEGNTIVNFRANLAFPRSGLIALASLIRLSSTPPFIYGISVDSEDEQEGKHYDGTEHPPSTHHILRAEHSLLRDLLARNLVVDLSQQKDPFLVVRNARMRSLPLEAPCCFCKIQEPIVRGHQQECNSLLRQFGSAHLYPSRGPCQNISRTSVLIGGARSLMKRPLGLELNNPDKYVIFRFCGSNSRRLNKATGYRTDFWISNGQMWRSKKTCEAASRMIAAEPRKLSGRNKPRYLCDIPNRLLQLRFDYAYEKYTNGSYTTIEGKVIPDFRVLKMFPRASLIAVASLIEASGTPPHIYGISLGLDDELHSAGNLGQGKQTPTVSLRHEAERSILRDLISRGKVFDLSHSPSRRRLRARSTKPQLV
mmetsp:Transcript_25273/g.56829  ORF Transcript_25273/g.56829 Transcript_25273/m.56829 type:complete len:553 (-) Transcript_25273:59-1717(-)